MWCLGVQYHSEYLEVLPLDSLTSVAARTPPARINPDNMSRYGWESQVIAACSQPATHSSLL